VVLSQLAYCSRVDRYGRLDERKFVNTLWRKSMFEKAKSGRDAFTFSLGGMTTIASFVAVPAVADDQINRLRDDRLNSFRADRDRKPRLWFRRQPEAAQGT